MHWTNVWPLSMHFSASYWLKNFILKAHFRPYRRHGSPPGREAHQTEAFALFRHPGVAIQGGLHLWPRLLVHAGAASAAAVAPPAVRARSTAAASLPPPARRRRRPPLRPVLALRAAAPSQHEAAGLPVGGRRRLWGRCAPPESERPAAARYARQREQTRRVHTEP